MSASTAALPQPAGAPGITANPALLRIAAPTLLGVVLLAVWQLVCTTFAVPEYLVPSPLRIAQTLAEDWALLSSALLTTLKITFLAFALAVVLGVAAAFVFVQSRILEISLFPYAVILQVTPKAGGA